MRFTYIYIYKYTYTHTYTYTYKNIHTYIKSSGFSCRKPLIYLANSSGKFGLFAFLSPSRWRGYFLTPALTGGTNSRHPPPPNLLGLETEGRIPGDPIKSFIRAEQYQTTYPVPSSRNSSPFLSHHQLPLFKHFDGSEMPSEQEEPENKWNACSTRPAFGVRGGDTHLPFGFPIAC